MPTIGPPWSIDVGHGPVVATAVHNGHEVRPELARWFAIPESERWREEDPLTSVWTEVGDTRVRVYRSRFEVDLNRPRDQAVSELAWGHRVWQDGVPPALLEQSRALHDDFYREMRELIEGLLESYPRLLVLDLHTYNHRRAGPDAPPDDPRANPEINVGTGTLTARERFEPVVASFEQALRDYDFNGRHLDVRENVRFKGGYFPRWLHQTWPGAVCTLSIECKKFFMDEWTSEASIPELDTVRRGLAAATARAREALAQT